MQIPGERHRPTTPEEIAAIVREARGLERGIRLDGHGSKRAIGHPVAAEIGLDLTGLQVATQYEPDELVLTVSAGAGVLDVRTVLAQQGQDFAFEPQDYGPLLGQQAGRGTIGGLVAANLGGPRRPARGAARDHLLGIQAVTGSGDIFRAGGRVVKNVTGYDLSRAVAGSWGTLAILTEVTLKVLPVAETALSLAVFGLDPRAATAAMAAAMAAPVDVTGTAYLPDGGALGVGDLAAGRSVTLARLEGTPASVTARRDRLAAILAEFGAAETIERQASTALWRAIGDARPLWPAAAPDMDVWRCSVAPSAGWAVARDAVARWPEARYFLDWQGGLVWLALPEGSDGRVLRAIVAGLGGGHATLIRASEATRATQATFQPPERGAAMLMRRLKANFDPDGILEPGRMELRP
jgi:glycolate oxidase FAD binding subunit